MFLWGRDYGEGGGLAQSRAEKWRFAIVHFFACCLQGLASQFCMLICNQTLWDSGYLHVSFMRLASPRLRLSSVWL